MCHVEDGTYDEITKQIKAMDSSALSYALYGQHFTHAVSSNGNYFYTDTSDSKEFRVCLFGEICNPTLGTVINAKGNYWPGPNSLVSLFISSRPELTSALPARG
jgi:hypothetical protein